jgi:hypothetical protein
LSEDAKLYSIKQNIQIAQGEAQKIKETMSSVPPANKMMTMQ